MKQSVNYKFFMKIATNINSIRLRIDIVVSFIKNNMMYCVFKKQKQKISFFLDKFINNGFIYSNINGCKSYNGVAIISKTFRKKLMLCERNDAR